jgi:hypothetical protein
MRKRSTPGADRSSRKRNAGRKRNDAGRNRKPTKIFFGAPESRMLADDLSREPAGSGRGTKVIQHNPGKKNPGMK